ncbi:flagellin N-methylase [Bacteriovorax sp. BSW11_IV]|nr:flagellin N-methylase [Bacteriovorax sp. BSW11_IV]
MASIIIEGHDIDLKRLYIQSEAQNDDVKWFKTPYDIRRCVFLNNKNECSIYENRPAVCRTNMVMSDPSDCATMDGKQRPIRLINTDKANMAIMAGYTVARTGGTLPYLLWKTLHRFKGPRSPQGESAMGEVRHRLKQAQNTVSKIFSM